MLPKSKDLLSLHQRILDRITQWSSKNDTLVEVFSNIGDYYDIYMEYCSNHENAYNIYKDLMKRKQFQKLHKDLCKMYNWVSFDSFLISPVQRIPRYQLYLKDLMKHTYNGNQFYQNYQVSIEKVKNMLTAINSDLKNHERYIKPSVDLQKVNFKEKLNILNRNCLAEYDMYMINGDIKPNNKTKYKVLLFTNLLLVLKKKFRGVDPFISMEINQSSRILKIPQLKYFPNWVKITNASKCIILRTENVDDWDSFVQLISDWILESQDNDHSPKASQRHISISGLKRDYLVSDVIYTEWQGKSWAFAIRMSGENSSFSKIIFKFYNEFNNFYKRLFAKEELKEYLPAFPTEKYIINGSTMKVEYRRLTLDYFMQNLFLWDEFQNSVYVSIFFKLTKEMLPEYVSQSSNKMMKNLKILLLNKQSIEVEVYKDTEAVEIWDYICEQLKLHYVKDKRLFILRGQRIVKVFDNNEYILKVIDSFKGSNKIGKMSITKIKNESSELNGLGKYLGLPESDEISIVFMKWCYMPYDFDIKEADETIETLNLKAMQMIADFQTKKFNYSNELTKQFRDAWALIKNDKTKEEIKGEKQTRDSQVSIISTASSSDKNKLMGLIRVGTKLPFYGISLFWGEVYDIKK